MSLGLGDERSCTRAMISQPLRRRAALLPPFVLYALPSGYDALESHVGKEKGFTLSSIRTRDMRRYRERQGYRVEPGRHKHLKLKHPQHSDVLLPLRPSDNLSHVAVKQIAAAMGMTPEQLTVAIR